LLSLRVKSVVWVRTALAVERWPLLTMALLVVNIALFVLIHHTDAQREQRLAVRGVLALGYLQQHPYLTLKPPLDELVGTDTGEQVALDSDLTNLAGVGGHMVKTTAVKNPENVAVLLLEQAELDAKVGAFAKVAGEWQSSSFGYVPMTRRWWTLISYQFIHRSWVHLLGNLCFLLLVGRRVEVTLGTTSAAALYVGSGIAAALVHHVAAVHSVVPLIGASGAIAGLLGAFVVCAAEPLAPFARPASFFARHWVSVLFMVWFATELAQALLPHCEGSVSHFAHVGGFIFGVAFSWMLRVNGHEHRPILRAP